MLQHKHLIVRAEVLTPPIQKDVLYMHEWFEELIQAIGMKILAGPFVHYHDVPGNRGMTGVSIIETSHVALHVWDEDNPAIMQLDVYTCGVLDKSIVFHKLKQFSPLRIEYKYLDRETSLELVDRGNFDYSSLFDR